MGRGRGVRLSNSSVYPVIVFLDELPIEVICLSNLRFGEDHVLVD